QRLQRANLTLHTLGAFMVALVDHENVGDFHDAGFDALHVVSHAGHQNHNRNVSHADDINLVLPNTDSFDHDDVPAGRIEHHGDISGSAGQASERTARRH